MYPALPYDTSAELAEENKVRRGLHSRVLDRQPSAFHRYSTIILRIYELVSNLTPPMRNLYI